MATLHTFAGNPLDRGDVVRRDAEAVAALAARSDTRYLPFNHLAVLVRGTDTLELGWVAQPEIAAIGQHLPPPVFLGLLQGIAHFAVDVTDAGDPLGAVTTAAPGRFEDAGAAAMVLPGEQTGILAQARSQLDWHRRHGFCSVCGEPTVQAKGGHVRRCEACGSEHFPRTDPVAIMLILDGDRCLLGQSAGRLARTGMYSALAGFVDQGESIEEAVRREIREEAGITVGEVRYHSSQPWPFPSSLMIGCHGLAASTDIVMDTEEMADVRWFDRGEVVAALAQEHPKLKVPGPIAIAHHLINAWIDGQVRFD